jgi:hypothetical protein
MGMLTAFFVTICSEVKSHLESHSLTPVTRLYTQHTHRHPGVASSSTMGEVTYVRVNKTYSKERVKTQDMRTIYPFKSLLPYEIYDYIL